MSRNGWSWLSAALAALLAPASPAPAAQVDYGRVSGRVWTVGRDYRTIGAGGDPVVLQRVDEYLSFGWNDAGSRGLDVDLLLRGRVDHLTRGVPQDEGDLLGLRVSWSFDSPRIDVTVGRQFLIWGNGYYNFDGARFDWRARRGWTILAFHGLPLVFQEHSGLRTEGRTFGAGVSFERPFLERYALVAERQTRADDVTRERLSLDVRRAFGARLEGYASADYNAGLARWGDSLAGVRARLGRRLRVGAEHLRYLPDFPLDSIFNVFPVEAFGESRLEGAWEGSDAGGAWLRLGRQRFARAAVRERDRHFVELTLRPPRRGQRWMEVTLFQATGYGGDRRGARLAGGAALPWSGMSIRGGADLHDFRNPFRLVEREDAWSVWGRLNWEARRGWNVWVEGRQQWSVLGRRQFDTAAGAGVRFGAAL